MKIKLGRWLNILGQLVAAAPMIAAAVRPIIHPAKAGEPSVPPAKVTDEGGSEDNLGGDGKVGKQM